jgi:ferric-dicitrate binding protein FerR (iron transport regulator)
VSDELFDKYLTRQLHGDDIARLKRVLSQPDGRTRFVRALQEWQVMAEVVHHAEAQSCPLAIEDEVAALVDSANGAAADGPRRRRPASHGRAVSRPANPWYRAAAVMLPVSGLAALLLVAVLASPAPQAGQPLAAIATAKPGVTVLRGAATMPAEAGLMLLPGDLLRVPKGAGAVVRYPDRTTVDVGASTSVAFQSGGDAASSLGKRVNVAWGTVRAEVAKQPPGHPMVFLTPTAQAIVLGTRLSLVVDAASSRLEVEEGRVAFARNSDQGRVEVGAGQFALATPTGEFSARPVVAVAVRQPSGERKRGIKAEYFDDLELRTTLFSRIEEDVSHDLGLGSPTLDLRPGRFSVRWSGDVEPLYSETYAFSVRADSGVRLWVDNRLLIDAWGVRVPREHSANIALQAGKRYALRLEYVQPNSGKLISLSWTSASQPLEVIPAERLSTIP